MTGKNRKNYNKNYIAYVNSFDPPTKHFKNCFRAFIVGGLICCIGQFLRGFYEQIFALSGDELASAVSITLIFLGATMGKQVSRSSRVFPSPLKTTIRSLFITAVCGFFYFLYPTPFARDIIL